MSSFLHPGMLWGLALASVPIVIHLLNRRRYRSVRWAAMDFLRKAFRKNQRRIRFENLLLLLVRTALIVLLVLALARPYLRGAVAGTLSSQATHYTLVIDNSYSMGLNEGVSTPFERAIQESMKIVSTLDREDTLTLYLTNDNFLGARPGIPRSVLRESHDAVKLRSVLGKLRVSAGRSELVDVFAAVVDRLDAKVPGKRVVLLTDLQRTAWEAGPAKEGEGLSGGERTIRDLLADVDRKGASFHLIDVGADDPENVAILSVMPAEARPLIEGNAETFVATLMNYGRRATAVDVRWSVDGQHKGSSRIEVPAAPALGESGVGRALFSLPPLDEGAHAIAAEIPTDMLAVDDRRLYCADVREAIRILAVDGDPDGAAGFTTETYFLKRAIALKEDRIRVEVVDYLAFISRNLDEFDMVILANVERVREDRVAALEEFVAKGGALVVFLGNRVDPSIANELLGKEGRGLMPGILDPEPVTLDKNESTVRFSLTDAPAHPLFSRILGPRVDPDNLWEALTPRVWGYYKVKPLVDDKTVTVLLRLTDAERHPALLEKRFGKGLVFLYTTSADMDWSTFPAPFSVSIPLLHEMVYYMTRRDSSRSNLSPFGVFARELPERVMDVQVVTPDGGKVKVEPVVVDEEGRKRRLEFRETEEPGLYRVSYSVRGASAIDAGTFRSTELFSVNVDSREGDVRRLSRSEITNRYAASDLHYARTFSGLVDARSSTPGGEVWKGLLVSVLALLFLEIFIARRFGDYARRTGRAV